MLKLFECLFGKIDNRNVFERGISKREQSLLPRDRLEFLANASAQEAEH